MKGSLIAFNRYTRRGACGHARVHGHHDHVALRRINWRGRGLPLRHLRPFFSSSFLFFFFLSFFFFFFFSFFRKPFTVHCAAWRRAPGKIALRARRERRGRGEFFLRGERCDGNYVEKWTVRGEFVASEDALEDARIFCVTSVKSMKRKGREIEVVYFMKTWPRREGQWRNL